MRCPNCNIGQLEYEDDIESESWSDYQGEWRCPNCNATYNDFTVTAWQNGADILEELDDDLDDDIDYDDPDDSDYEYEYDIDDAEAGE